MPKQQSTFVTFVFFLLVSFLILFLSMLPIFSPLGFLTSKVTIPLQQAMYHLVYNQATIDAKIKILSDENALLREKLVNQNKLLAENNALRDQFTTAHPSSASLLPAMVIGAPEFVPGISLPQALVLDKGSNDGVKKGQAVVSKDSLIGTITAVSATRSTLSLLIHGGTPFTAKTLETKAIGVVNGENSTGLALTNVLLSQQLKRGDMVLTKGDVYSDGIGIPPDLLVGEIIDIDKKASNLFQTAKLKSLVDPSVLTTVFIVQATH